MAGIRGALFAGAVVRCLWGVRPGCSALKPLWYKPRVAESPAELLLREKERARALLADGYARDLIDQDVLDERLETVEQARTVAEVRAMTAELAVAEPATTALVPVHAGKPEKIGALFGSVERHGAWGVASHMRVRVLFGSVVLDLRTAQLPDGPIEVEVSVTFGNLDVIVPPGWQIDNRCTAVLASVEQQDSHAPPSQAPRVLRLTGRAVFGSVTVIERLPGEGSGDARRRRRRERRALAEAHAKALPRGQG